MDAKYYVAIRPQTNDQHAVHKEDCPFLPEDEKRIYLGMFDSGNEALKEGQRHFTSTNCCPFCLKDHHTANRKLLFPGSDIPGNIPSMDLIPKLLKAQVFYLLN